VSIEVEEKINQIFGLSYLVTLTNLTHLSEYLNLFFKNNIPCMIEIPINHTDGFLQYYLAPKLLDENN